MSRLFDQLLQSLGDVLRAPAIQLGAQLIGAYLVVVWLASAYWAFRDMGRRTASPLPAFLDAALVIVATPILFPAALLVHFVVRPPETAAEREDRRLRAQALAMELPAACRGCGATVRPDWLVCPACGTTQRHRCEACDRLVETDWEVCAWCANELAAPAGTVDPSPPRQAERLEPAGAPIPAGWAAIRTADAAIRTADAAARAAAIARIGVVTARLRAATALGGGTSGARTLRTGAPIADTAWPIRAERATTADSRLLRRRDRP